MMPMNFNSSSLLYLLGLVPLAIGLWLLKRCISQFSWNETEGRIIQSESDRLGRKGGVTPLIRYEYQVGLQNLVSDKFSADNFTLGVPFAVQSVLNRYPLGQKVKVFYNPNNPEQSVLERRVTIGAYVWIAIGLFFLITIHLAKVQDGI